MISMSSTSREVTDYSVLILDTVNSGQKSEGGEIIEIAAALYSVRYRCILSQVSTLLPLKRPANAAVKANQIPLDAAQSIQEQQYEPIVRTVCSWAREAKYCLAHNAEHDRKWMSDHWLLASLCRCVWLCSCYDFAWPRQERPGMHLVHLALAHGIGVSTAHRASSSCELLAALLSSLGDDLVDVMHDAARPRCKVQVKGHLMQREKALSTGFRWNAVARSWLRWSAIDDLPSIGVKHSVIEVDPRGDGSVVWARLWQMYIAHRTADVETRSSMDDLSQRLWHRVRENASLWGAVEHLWTASVNGSMEPKGLLETFGALEIWHWTTMHLNLTKNSMYIMPCAEDLPDGLGSESGDATSQSDETIECVSVESVVEQVAESCLEPEDRQGSFSPSFLQNGMARPNE